MRQKTGLGRTRSERQAGVIAIACAVVPLALSGCNSTDTKSSLAEKPVAGTADAYGYAPVRVTAFADGTRIAMPTDKPDMARIADAKAAVAAKSSVPAVTSAAEADKSPAGTAKGASDEAGEVAALKADVAERKAQQASQAIAELSASRQSFKPGAAPAAVEAPVAAAAAYGAPAPEKTSRVASIAELPVKGARAVAGGAKQAVATTIETVGDGAEAAKDLTVAAVDTTVSTARKVSQRIGDTFKGTDTITGSSAIDRMIEQSAADNNIPTDLAYAVVRVESHYNPTAIGGGAYGLSQIKPATARGLGFAGPANSLLEPETNLRYGMKYLAGAWEKSGHDICGTAMRYKGGHRTTRMTRSASVYCANVKRHMAAIERRRGPANRGVVVAAAEREKTVAAASQADTSVASHSALPGVPVPTSRAILTAAGSDSGRRVASSATTTAPGGIALAPAFASSAGERGGRVIGAALD